MISTERPRQAAKRRIVPVLPAPLCDLRQGAPIPVRRGLALHDRTAFLRAAPEVTKTQKVERLRRWRTTRRGCRRWSLKPHQAGLVRLKLQTIPGQPLGQIHEGVHVRLDFGGKLVPGERRSYRRAGSRAGRVRCNRGRPALVAQVIDEHLAAPFRFAHRGDVAVALFAGQRVCKRLGELLQLVPRVAACERNDDVQPFAARGAQKTGKADCVQAVAHIPRTLDDRFPLHSFAGVQIEHDLVGPLELIFARRPRMNLKHAHLHQRHDTRDIVHRHVFFRFAFHGHNHTAHVIG